MALIVAVPHTAFAGDNSQTKFKRVPTQFIAASGDPGANSGEGAEAWGLWPIDPGPRGVWLDSFDRLQAAGGVAKAEWVFDDKDWWLEENGLIMEKPQFPLPPGKYVVTGDRSMTTVLTIHPADESGNRAWELDDEARLYDVTHLKCRSARYTPVNGSDSCSPALADSAVFPVTPGGPMPPVPGCHKQDYTVLFIVGVAVDN